jgi:ketosteroid isomerase-like protein
MSAKSWNEAQLQMDLANHNLLQGNAADLKQLYSHQEDVTVFGGFGGKEHGWKEVGPRLDWAASQFAGGSYEREILSAVEGGDLAYIVSIETNRVRETGKAAEDLLVLRVTQIFRREGGEWRLVHRHADQQVNKRPD